MYPNSTHMHLLRNCRKTLLMLLVLVGLTGVGNAQSTNPAPYCGASHPWNNPLCDMYNTTFQKIKLGGLNFITTCPVLRSSLYNYYQASNFSSYTTTLVKGADYTISMEIYNGDSYQTSATGVWIDYNQDGDFADAGEFIGATKYQTGGANKTHTLKVKVPCNATNGKTRMRCRVGGYYQGNSSPNHSASGSCGNVQTGYGLGETIDFDVTLKDAGAPVAGFNLPADTIFVNSPVTFINKNQAGYTHEWYTEEVANPGFAMEGTDVNQEITFFNAGTYNVRVKSTNCIGSSTITKQVVVYNPTSPPTPKFIADRTFVEIKPGDVANEDIYFYDLSTGGPDNWIWSYYSEDVDEGDYVYFVMGGKNELLLVLDTCILDVSLEVSNVIGTNTLTKKDYVKVMYPNASGGNKFTNWMCNELSSALDSGEIYDNGGPGDYINNGAYCTFTIAPCDASAVELKLDELKLNCYDFLYIYDGPNVGAPLLKAFGETGTPPIDKIVAKSGKMTLLFTTDMNNWWCNSSNPNGFHGVWNAVKLNDGPPVANFDISNISHDTVYSCASGTTVNFFNSTKGNAHPDGYQWILDYSPNVKYPVGFADAITRDASKTYTTTGVKNVRMIAETCEGWDTVIRTFIITAPATAPIPDFKADEEILFINGVTTLRNQSSAACDLKWSISPNTGFTTVSGSDVSDNWTLRFTEPRRYHITLTATNGNGTTAKTKTDYIRVIDYCVPDAQIRSTEAGITYVGFAGIDNISTSGLTAYTDFTSLGSYDVVMGKSYDLKISRASNIDPVDRQVWVDYNRNGIFENSEVIVSETNSLTKDLVASIKMPGLPDNAIPGQMRMRVVCALSGYGMSACGPLTVAEYEDYLLNLKADDMPPAITILGDNPLLMEVGPTYTDSGATALDNIEGDITGRMNKDEQVDPTQAGYYYVTYTVTDNSGTPARAVRQVIVKTDLTAPVIAINGGNTIVHEAMTPFVVPTATITDNPGATTISNYKVTNNVDETMIGTYTVEYEATDKFGNVATETLTVDVKDQTAPVIDTTAGSLYKVQLNSPFVDPTKAHDTYWKDDEITLTTNGVVVDPNVPGQYPVEYTAKDGSGNTSAVFTRTYWVNDFIKPVLTDEDGVALNAFQTIVVDVNNTAFAEPVVKATDNMSTGASITRTGSYDITTIGTYTIIYTAEDGFNNVNTLTRKIVVVDRERADMFSTLTKVERWTNFDPMKDDGNLQIMDNYFPQADFFSGNNGCRLVVIANFVNTLEEGFYEVIYQAIDGEDNVSKPHARLVQVVGRTGGIADADYASMINVYPNPSNGKFNVEFGTATSKNLTVEVLNMLGEVVATYHSADVQNSKIAMNLGHLAAGVYTIQIADQSQVATKKITLTR